MGYDNLFHLTTNGGAFDISHPLFNFFHITKWAIVKVVDMAAHTDIRAVFCLSLMNFLVCSGLVLLYRYLKRIVLLPVRRALLLTLLCGGSFTTIVLSFTTETYPFSFFLLILSLLVLSWEYKMRRRYQTYTMTVFALLLGGVTISNAGKPLLASLVGVSSFGRKVRNSCISLIPLLVCTIFAFGIYSLKNILMGHPVKSNFSRSLFSTNRLYGSLMYCGRLQKNANFGDLVGSCVTYFTFIYLPFHAGGG